MATSTDAESSKLPSQGHTPTALGITISGAKNTEQKITILKNQTLNERYGVKADDAIGVKEGKDFKLGWFGIGIKGGEYIGQNEFGLEVRRILEHQATDGNAFKPIPFVIRTLENDLDEEQRKRYRLRVVATIGSVTYVFYYLRAIGWDYYDPTVKTGYYDSTTKSKKEDAYTPQLSDLSPEPYKLKSTDSIPATDWYTTGTGTMDMTLESEELDEIRNVCRIMFNDASVARLAEWYLVFGIDTVVADGLGNSGTAVRYNELVPACTSYIVTESTGRDCNTSNRMKMMFEYGNSVPLLTTIKTVTG